MSLQCRYHNDNVVHLSFNENESFNEPLQQGYLQLILLECGCATLRVNRERCFIQSGALIFRSDISSIDLLNCNKMKARSISFKCDFFDKANKNSFDNRVANTADRVIPFHLFYEISSAYVGILPLDSLLRPKAYALLSAAISEMQNQPDNMWCSRVLINLIELFRLAEDEYIRYTGSNSPSASIANKALDYIHANYDKEITVETLCHIFHTNHTTLLRNFRTLTGTTIGQYVLEHRLRLVCEALTYTALTLDEISSKFGFKQASYLSRVFRSRIGITPGQYRRGLRV